LAASVSFLVVVGRQIFEVDVDPRRALSHVFKFLNDEYNIPELKKCKSNDCSYQKLRVPVMRDNERMRETLEACSKQGNWEELSHGTGIKSLAAEWELEYVYLVVELPFGEVIPLPNGRRLTRDVGRARLERPQNAILQLNDNEPELFKRLQITVRNLRDWTAGDVTANGGTFLSTNGTPREVIQMTNRLKRKRTYCVSVIRTIFFRGLQSHYRRTVAMNYA